MAGLLDSLLLNLDRETAPEQRPFSLQNFMTDASQMGNVLAKNEERQRQNSLRRLIEQRESEGFGYDQLSNEAAKYDMDAANAMRREFRDSYQFNQKQSDVELQRYKREMADYWFGEVLRRAQLAGLGPAELKEVCFEAAGLIAPYDSELAYRLLMQSEKMYSGEEKRRIDEMKAKAKKEKQFKDDHVKMFDQKDRFLAEQTNNNNPDIRQKAAAEYTRLNKLEVSLAAEGYPIYTWMTGFLKHHPGGYDAAIQTLKDNFDWEKPNGMEYSTLGKINVSNEDLDDLGKGLGIDTKSSSTNMTSRNSTPASSGSDGNGSSKFSFVTRSQSSLGEIVKPVKGAYQKIASSLKSVDNLDDLDELSAAIDEYATAEGKTDVGTIKQRLAEKRKGLESVAAELGADTPENRLIARTLTARGKQAEARRLRQIGTVASGLYSGTPYSIIDNILMVQSPDYQISEGMQNTAYRIKNGEWSTELLSAFGSQKGFLGRLAQNATVYDMLEAGARDALNTIRPIYTTMLEECKDDAERKNLKNALKKTFGWPDRLFKALEDPNGSLGTAETIRKKSEALMKKPVNVYDDDEGSEGSNNGGNGYMSNADFEQSLGLK